MVTTLTRLMSGRAPAGQPLVAAWLSGSLRIASDLAARDLRSRYAGSAMGIVWFLVTPLLMMGIYATVFGIVLKLSWRNPVTGASAGFFVPFVAGMAVYLLAADLVISSLSLFAAKRSYVKKSPFPIWVLWLANLMRAGAHALVNLLILLGAAVLSGVLTPSGLLWLVPAIAVIAAFSAATSLFLAVLGPFLSDLSEAARVAMRLLFYAAPVTYPLAIVPERLRWLSWSDPLTWLIEPLRNAVAFGIGPAPGGFLVLIAATAALGAVSYWLFRRLKGAIIDVV